MKRILRSLIFGLAFLLGYSYHNYVQGVNFTIVLTQAEVDIATWEWNQEDSTHVQWTTAQLFGADKVKDLIAEWKNRRIIKRLNTVGSPTGYFCTNTWASLSQANKDSVCTALLGDVAGCTPCDANGN